MGATNMQNNPYVPWPSKILDVIRHTQKEYTFRMEYVGDVSQEKYLRNTKDRAFFSAALTETVLIPAFTRTVK